MAMTSNLRLRAGAVIGCFYITPFIARGTGDRIMSIRRIRLTTIDVLLLLFVSGIGACHSDKATGVSAVSSVKPDAGVNAQTGTVGQALGARILVHVADANGDALAGIPVRWTIIKGGFVDSTSTNTNASGDAGTDWTLGPVVGADSLTATAGSGINTVIIATALAGPIASLTKQSGDGQSVTAGSAAQPLVVEVLDQYGNGVAGATVTWSVAGGGSLSATSTTSEANGLAQTTLTTDPAAATYTITASAGSATAVTFSVIAN